MIETEKNIFEGWTIHPPENTHKVRQWIINIEAMTESEDSSGDRQPEHKENHEKPFRLC